MNKKQKTKIKKYLEKMEFLLIRKGHDYSGEKDTLKSFKILEDIGITAQMILLGRIGEKMSRIKQFYLNNELKIKDETIEDTLLDLANYCLLLILLLEGDEENEVE